MEFFARGRRSEVFKDFYKGKLVAVKKGAKKVVEKEYKFLKILNKHGVGPKVYFVKKDCVVYEFVEGVAFKDFIKGKDISEVKPIVLEILRQCRVLDKIGINKLEFTRPLKHVFVGDNVIMIDFERCYYTDKPKNVSQFCAFLEGRFKVDLREEVKKYKKSYLERDFKRILRKI